MPAHHFFIRQLGQSAGNRQVEEGKHAADKPCDGILPAALPCPCAVFDRDQQALAV